MSLKVGIVGLPNVGKSTLFNALRQAQGKLVGNPAYVANYPFSTIESNVGVVTTEWMMLFWGLRGKAWRTPESI